MSLDTLDLGPGLDAVCTVAIHKLVLEFLTVLGYEEKFSSQGHLAVVRFMHVLLFYFVVTLSTFVRPCSVLSELIGSTQTVAIVG